MAVPKNVVRYDSPTFAGFSASASWGEDDEWAVSARYSGEHHGMKLAVAAAYNQSKDEGGPGGILGNGPAFDASAFQVGAYLEHVATGLWIYGAYAEEYIDTPGNAKPEGDMWYIKAGIRQRWLPLGSTVLYFEYGEDDDKMNNAAFAAGAGVTASELERYGLGVVQEIDAAAMSVWLSWRHYEASATCANAGCGGLGVGNAGANDFEEFDLIKAGALINF